MHRPISMDSKGTHTRILEIVLTVPMEQIIRELEILPLAQMGVLLNALATLTLTLMVQPPNRSGIPCLMQTEVQSKGSETQHLDPTGLLAKKLVARLSAIEYLTVRSSRLPTAAAELCRWA